HIAVMADCERGLGRPERALDLAAEVEDVDLPLEVRAELAIVLSGARRDLGQPDAAVAVLAPYMRSVRPGELPETRARVAAAYADALDAAGRADEAAEARREFPEDGGPDVEPDIVVIDLEAED